MNSPKDTEESDYIKSKLPSNIKIGGMITNNGSMSIIGEKMPQSKPTGEGERLDLSPETYGSLLENFYEDVTRTDGNVATVYEEYQNKLLIDREQYALSTRLDELNHIPHHLLHIPEVWEYKQARTAELKVKEEQEI